jgi:formamidopyrimidine-DNA glycosylase
VALLDQRAVAGIGNLYASEILHRARMHPERTCDSLRPAQWRNLHSAMREVLEEAIRSEGSTLSDGTYRVGRNRPGGFQVLHRVYQRAGQRCVQCGKAEIVRTVQAQRSTFFCPWCQRINRRR